MCGMRVIGPSRVKQWADQYPGASAGLATWLTIAIAADWSSLAEVRRDFPQADGVKVRSGNTVTVFNIGGNKYRLIAAIKYPWRTLYALRFLTHAEYDKDRWKHEL